MRTVQLPQQCQVVAGGVDAGPFAAARCFAFAGVSDPGYKGSADLCIERVGSVLIEAGREPMLRGVFKVTSMQIRVASE